MRLAHKLWLLDSWHTFLFGGYHDSTQMGFRTLRVTSKCAGTLHT